MCLSLLNARSLPSNFKFDASVPAWITLRTATTRHRLVKALVDGGDVGCFILDTGAGIVGYGVPGRTVTVSDDAAEWIELHDSSTCLLPSGEWSEVALYARHPAASGA